MIGNAVLAVPTEEDGDTEIYVGIDKIGSRCPSYSAWYEFAKNIGIAYGETNFHFGNAVRLLRKEDLEFLNSIPIAPLGEHDRDRLEWLRETVKEALETCSIPAISFD